MNTGVLLLDNSAWARLSLPSLPDDRAADIALAFETGAIAVCLPFLLEAGYSARDATEHDTVIDELLSEPFVNLDARVEERAIDAQRQLARAGHHRLPPVDLMLAAAADRHGHGILHYDADYDLILEQTDLDFESVWLAGRGTL